MVTFERSRDDIQATARSSVESRITSRNDEMEGASSLSGEFSRKKENTQFIKRTNIIFIVCNKQRNIISPLAQSHDGKTTRKRYYISVFSHHYLFRNLSGFHGPLTKQYTARGQARNRPISTFLLLNGYISNK